MGGQGGGTATESAEERVYHRLRTALAKRYIGPGRQLVEETLAKQLGVSRTPIRAAIRRLEREGLVDTVPRRGAFVVTPTRREIEDAFAVRTQLEAMAARLAAGAAGPEDIAYLEGLIGEEARVFDQRLNVEYYRVSDSIHLRIADLSGNKTLRAFVADVLSRVNIYLILFDPFERISLNRSMNEHLAVVEALRRHDGPGAEQAMRAHLENTLAALELDQAAGFPEDYLNV